MPGSKATFDHLTRGRMLLCLLISQLSIREMITENVAFYRDHFLAGFTLRDSAAFDEFQFFQTEELRR